MRVLQIRSAALQLNRGTMPQIAKAAVSIEAGCIALHEKPVPEAGPPSEMENPESRSAQRNSMSCRLMTEAVRDVDAAFRELRSMLLKHDPRRPHALPGKSGPAVVMARG